jgi:hypothetical protein
MKPVMMFQPAFFKRLAGFFGVKNLIAVNRASVSPAPVTFNRTLRVVPQIIFNRERVFVLANPITGDEQFIRLICTISNAVDKRSGYFNGMVAAGVVNVNNILKFTDSKAVFINEAGTCNPHRNRRR